MYEIDMCTFVDIIQRFRKASTSSTTTIKRINNEIMSAAPVLKINTMSSCGDPFVADQRSPTEVAPVYPHFHFQKSSFDNINNCVEQHPHICGYCCNTQRKIHPRYKNRHVPHTATRVHLKLSTTYPIYQEIILMVMAGPLPHH